MNQLKSEQSVVRTKKTAVKAPPVLTEIAQESDSDRLQIVSK